MSLKKDCFLYDVPEHKKHKLEIINLIKQIPKNSYNNITHTDWNLPPSLHRAWYDYFIKNIFILLYPVTPIVSKKFLECLNIQDRDISLKYLNTKLKTGEKLTKPEILFKKF